MTGRDAPSHGEPIGIDDTYPGYSPGATTWSRAHKWRENEVDGGCWFFASRPDHDGRFDLRDPRGTCYWADAELAAARERLGRSQRLVAHDEVERARVSTQSFDPGRLANLLAEAAALFGVTQELSSSGPYSLTQRWAAAFDSAGFDGVHYQPRFSTQRAQAIAVFGLAGRPSDSTSPTSTRPMADVLLEHGYTIISGATASQLSPLID